MHRPPLRDVPSEQRQSPYCAGRLMVTHPFAPVVDENCRTLILGSFPSVKSRENGFYYGHPQNRFWRMLAAVYADEVPESIAEKTSLLLRHQLALWDVIANCEIDGSADASGAHHARPVQRQAGGNALRAAFTANGGHSSARPALHQPGKRSLDAAEADRRVAQSLDRRKRDFLRITGSRVFYTRFADRLCCGFTANLHRPAEILQLRREIAVTPVRHAPC